MLIKLIRIRELDRLDEKRRLREESRNNLESFVYRVQEYLYDDDILAVSTEEQQEELRNRLSKTSDWLYDEGEDADTQEYLDRLRSLQYVQTRLYIRWTSSVNCIFLAGSWNDLSHSVDMNILAALRTLTSWTPVLRWHVILLKQFVERLRKSDTTQRRNWMLFW